MSTGVAAFRMLWPVSEGHSRSPRLPTDMARWAWGSTRAQGGQLRRLGRFTPGLGSGNAIESWAGRSCRAGLEQPRLDAIFSCELSSALGDQREEQKGYYLLWDLLG